MRMSMARLAAFAFMIAVGAAGTASAAGARYVYACDGGDSLRVDPIGNWEAIVLHMDGGLFLLPHVIAASGMRYSDGSTTFWAKGEEAFVEVDGAIVKTGCALLPVPTEGFAALDAVLEFPVASCAVLDVGPFNRRVAEACGAGDAWVRDPVPVVLEYLGGLDGRVAGLVRVDDRGEEPDSTVVTVVREGLEDDSVRSVWDEVHLTRTADGTWSLVSSYRAYRCWRRAQERSFSAEPCP